MKPAPWIMALMVTFFIVQDAEAGRVVRRERRQAARIQQGENSGQLTQGEAKRLEKGEARIENTREAALSDGHMGAGERRKLHNMQNRESRRIWRAKHNGKTADGAAPGADAPAAPVAAEAPAQPSGQ